MSSILIAGDTSGAITISAPAVSGTTTLTLPAVSGTILQSGTVVTVAQGGTGVTTSTGTGAVVLGTSPTLTTPTFDSASLVTISGTAPLYMCRAWVNFNGTGTVAIRASGNVSSITDNGTGDYTVNLTTAMADTNGTVVGASVETIGAFTGGLRAVMPSFASTSTIRVGVCYTNGGPVDMPYVGIIVIR